MLGDRQELDMGVARALDVIDEPGRELAISEPLAVSAALPRSQLNVGHGERRLARHTATAGAHPFAIAPFVIQAPCASRRAGRSFPAEGERIALVGAMPIGPDDEIFVGVAVAHARGMALPDPGSVAARRER